MLANSEWQKGLKSISFYPSHPRIQNLVKGFWFINKFTPPLKRGTGPGNHNPRQSCLAPGSLSCARVCHHQGESKVCGSFEDHRGEKPQEPLLQHIRQQGGEAVSNSFQNSPRFPKKKGLFLSVIATKDNHLVRKCGDGNQGKLWIQHWMRGWLGGQVPDMAVNRKQACQQ